MPYVNSAVQRKYQRHWRQGRRDEWFADKICVDCGSTKNLELDHIDRAIKEDHRIWSWCAERREVELEKCVVRCTICHQERTSRQVRRDAEIRNPCGTLAAYKRGCRCDACRQENIIACREYKKKRWPNGRSGAHGRT